MQIKDLKEIIKKFDDEKDVIVFSEIHSKIFDVVDISSNNGHLQINIE